MGVVAVVGVVVANQISDAVNRLGNSHGLIVDLHLRGRVQKAPQPEMPVHLPEKILS